METVFIKNNIFSSKENLDQHEYKTRQYIARHVQWICKTGRPTIAKIGVIALVALECLALTLSVLGTYFIYRALVEYSKMKKVEAFNKTTKNPPPDLKELPLISKKACFNHTNYFVIHEGVIWTRPIRGNDQTWTPIYYKGKDPVEVQADGANLIVMDADRTVYYKKVIKEWRDPKDDHYCYADKSTKNNWKSEWFSLPIFHLIANIFTGKLLKIPSKSRAWSISHRSTYNNYQTDAIGQKHVEPVGTTQLYVLDSEGKSISIYDPWIHKNAKIKIPVPTSEATTFEAVNISASASTVMLIGYETSDAGDGTIKRELKIYTWFVDVDILGWNPGVKYDYPGNNPSPKNRVIPMPGYQEHPIQLPEKAKISSNIRIVQNGEGNLSRILLVEGSDEEGASGYYWKKIDDTAWQFTENSHEIGKPLKHEEVVEGNFVPETQNYFGEAGGVEVKLGNYGDQKYLFNLRFEKEGKSAQLVLNKRKTLLTFLGFNSHKYEIALPASIPEHLKETINKFFGNKKVVKASFTKLKDGSLQLKARKFSVRMSPVSKKRSP